MRFERSSAWPDDLAALRAAKAAFLVQICRSLAEYIPGVDPDQAAADQAKANAKAAKAANRAANAVAAAAAGGDSDGGVAGAKKRAVRAARAAAAAKYAPALECYPNEVPPKGNAQNLLNLISR